MSSPQKSPAPASPDDEISLPPRATEPAAIAPKDRSVKPQHRGRWVFASALLAILIAAAGFYGGFGLPQNESAKPVLSGAEHFFPPPNLHEPGDPSRESAPQDGLPLDPLTPETGAALLQEAARVANDLPRRFPENPNAWEMLARFQLEFGDMDQALAAWRRCLELNPDYVYAHVGLGKAAAERGEFDDAVAHYRRAVLADPNTRSHQMDLGKALLSAGEVDEALLVLEGVVKADSENARAHAELGAAQLQKRDDAAAQASLESALRLDPTYAPAHFGLATAYARLGDVEQARAHEAKYREASSERGEERGERIANYDDDQALRQDIARRYAEAARVYVAEGRQAAAERLWRRAARLDAENADSRRALAWLYLQQKKPFESIRMLREVSQLEPENVVYPRDIASLYVQLGRLEDAERTLQEFAQSAPANAQAQAALAEFYMQAKVQPESAVERAKQAAELSGTAQHWVLLSAAHELTGELPAAIAAMEQALQRAPENLQFRQSLALLKERAAGADAGRTPQPRSADASPPETGAVQPTRED